ncbi:nucleotide-binding protein [Streptomonospora wellingtoniae]|uniref:AAA family ATPase n=1 Tax=Streptomonospora wellingtoniae TaxID=3075544 RepID=A0ABU2KXD3_9ACTN|nr:AAA family ATPase [Streptomonospora sp. DSM 45055]MDT0303964.1 AAA family ATPase [Streptomonospora sp. DSM 45055]
MPGHRDGGASDGAGVPGRAAESQGRTADRDAQQDGGAALDPPGPEEAAPPPAEPPAPPPWSNGAGGAPWTGGHSGFSQWAPPERAPSPAPDSRPDGGPARPNGAGPRPGEATEVFPPFRDEGEPAAGSWSYDPAAWGESPATPPRPTGRGWAPSDDGPQWTSAEPVRPVEDAQEPYGAPGEPPLAGDGPAAPPRVRPPDGSAPADERAAPGGDVPSPEQLPPLPPNAGPPYGGPGTGPGAGLPPAPPPEPSQYPGGPGGGADTGGRPAPPPGDWRPDPAPSGPQAWNAPPPPGPGQAQPPYAPGTPDGGHPDDYNQPYDAYSRPLRQPGNPHAHPGYDPYGAPPPPGAPEGYRPAQGRAPGGPPSGPQTGFQYSAHFADGVQAQQFPGYSGHPETAEDLRAENLVSDKRPGPSKGWRKMLHSATFGLVDVGESAAEQRRRELTERARTQVGGGHHRVAVLSLKGGVGKTTTTVALGSMLASLRGDRVLAVDANPDRGTLSDKVRLETAATIRDLLNERESISRYADIRAFTSQANSRLEILASDRDPAVSEAFSEDDYREVSWLLEHYYSICLTDCGTGLLHSAMRGVLGLADQIVLVSSASVDGARSASATLDWLEAHQYGSLVRGAVVVLSMVRTGKSSVDLDRLEQHFASRCRAVARVPWDAHLEEGAEVDLERLAPSTRDAYLQLAATVGESFAWPR